MPVVKSLSSHDASKEARRAFNMTAFMLAELPDGTFALCDRTQSVYVILDDAPSRDELRLYTTLFASARLASESRFYGEPSSAELARDIRRQFATPKAARPQAIPIEL